MERYSPVSLERILPVNLPCLEEFEVHDVPDAITTFLSVLRMPSSTNLHVGLYIPDELRYADPEDRWSGQVAACEDVAVLLAEHLSRSSGVKSSFKSLRVSHDTHPKGMVFEMRRDVEDCRDNSLTPETLLLPEKLQLRCHFPDEPWGQTFSEEPSFVERVLPILPACHSLQHLTVEHPLESPSVWVDGYSHFPVKQITIRCEYITALSLISSIKTIPTLFPHLSILVLEGMYLTEDIEDEDLDELLLNARPQLAFEYFSQNLNGILHRELVKFLGMNNAPRLSLRHCRLTETSLEELRSSAVTKGLDWDGHMTMYKYHYQYKD
ncbi:hypothetical protein OF83DRAFT_1086415 [Amylostereum chailletii]|nr:hypothetical protein OF83DRAFT_1086415 [Amylostereum chailletii]